jgi:integrase
MRRLIESVETRGDLFTKTAYVFASRNGTGLERKTARSALQRAVASAGLDLPHPTLHDLRHTHASMLIALDVSVVDIQHRLGHRKPDTTLRIYAHQWNHRDAQRSGIGNKLQALFDTEPAAATEQKGETV